jgi:hypothetical protein
MTNTNPNKGGQRMDELMMDFGTTDISQGHFGTGLFDPNTEVEEFHEDIENELLIRNNQGQNGELVF